RVGAVELDGVRGRVGGERMRLPFHRTADRYWRRWLRGGACLTWSAARTATGRFRPLWSTENLSASRRPACQLRRDRRRLRHGLLRRRSLHRRASPLLRRSSTVGSLGRTRSARVALLTARLPVITSGRSAFLLRRRLAALG